MNSRGRKKVVYDEDEILSIIKSYIHEFNHKGLLKYKDLYEYSFNLYEYKKINMKLSDDFWRKEGRQGRRIIDRLNENYNEINGQKNIGNIEIIDTEKVINEYINNGSKDKRQLIFKLKKNEVYAKKYLKIVNTNKSYESEIKTLEYKVKQLTKRSEALEEALFSLFSSSKNEESLKKLLNTGKTRSKYVDELFKNIFNDEIDIYSSLLRKYISEEKPNALNNDNRVSNLVNLYNKNRN